jgi:hypothetical protein
VRVILATLAVGCIATASVAALRGNWTAAAAFSLAFWGWCWLFISYTSAAAKVDRMTREDED